MYNGILGYIPLFSHPFFFVYGAIEIDFALSLKVDNKDFVCLPATILIQTYNIDPNIELILKW